MNGTHQQGFGYRARRTFVRLVTFLLILGLGGAVMFLLAQINARTFTLEVDNGQLVVMKGRSLPAGAVAYRPSDPKLADAYAPIPLEGQDASALVPQRFSEREELDRALFPLLSALAKPRITSDDPKQVEQGVYYLRRAQKLSGLTEEQRLQVQQMTSDVAYYQARQKLDDARKQIAEALTQLQLAAESQNKNARSANQMLSTVGPAAKQLEEALRVAVHTQSAPREPEPAAQQPGTQQPAAQQPGAQQPAAQPPGAQQPGTQQPTAPGTPEAQAPAQQPATGSPTPAPPQVRTGPESEPQARPSQPTP